MSKFKTNIWLAKPWIPGLFIFLLLASACFCIAWLINDNKFPGDIISVGLPVLIFCAAGTILLLYKSQTSAPVQKLVPDRTKLAEQRDSKNEYSYRILVEQAIDSIFIANFQGNFLVVNPAACEMSGYTEEELLRMRFHDLAIADEPGAMPFKLAEIAAGETFTSERKVRRKDGSIIDVEIAARIIAPNSFLAFVKDITERKNAANELLKSRESLRMLTNYIANNREEERLKLAKEIHDELGQQLTVLKMDVSGFGKKITVKDAVFATDINEMLGSINSMIQLVRKITSDLRPGMLDDIGLSATMDWYCEDFSKRTGIKTSFISDIPDDKFSEKININIFRIFQESLVNVATHSGAQKTDVSVTCRDHQLVILIEDNGKGFDSSLVPHDKTLGIQVMKERAMMMDGTYNINSIPGDGTIVEVSVPANKL